MPEGLVSSSSFAPSSSSRLPPAPRRLTTPPPRRDPFAPDGLFLLQRTPPAVTAASPRASHNSTIAGGLGNYATTMAHAAYVRRLAALRSPQRRPQLATLVGRVREGRRAAAAAALEAAQAEERRRLRGQQEAEMAGIWGFFRELTLGMALTSETYRARLAETRALAAGAERRFAQERRQLEREQARALREARGLPFFDVVAGGGQHIEEEEAKAEEEGGGKSAAAGGSSSNDDDDEDKEEEQVSANKKKAEGQQGGEAPPLPATPLKRGRRASLDSADSSSLPPPAAAPAGVVKRPRGRPPRRLIEEKDE